MQRSLHDLNAPQGKGKNGPDAARVQDLQEQLRAREEQIEDLQKRYEASLLRVEGLVLTRQASSSRPGLPSSHSTFFPTPATSPSQASGSRRRSTSLSSANHIRDLEQELQRSRKEASSAGDARSRLCVAEKERDRAVNDKMRLEKQLRAEMETLKGQLEDQGYELAHYKGNTGESPQIERLKQAVQAVEAERNTLQRKVEELEKAAGKQEHAEARLSELENEVEQLRAAKSTASKADAVDVAALESKVSKLEAELANAQEAASTLSTSPPAADNASTAKQNLKLQREIKTLKAQVDALQSELADRDDDILQARSGVPLPGSPKLAAADAISNNDILVEELRERIKALELQLEALGSSKQELALSNANLQTLLEAARGDLTIATHAQNAAQVEVEVSVDQNN